MEIGLLVDMLGGTFGVREMRLALVVVPVLPGLVMGLGCVANVGVALAEGSA